MGRAPVPVGCSISCTMGVVRPWRADRGDDEQHGGHGCQYVWYVSESYYHS